MKGRNYNQFPNEKNKTQANITTKKNNYKNKNKSKNKNKKEKSSKIYPKKKYNQNSEYLKFFERSKSEEKKMHKQGNFDLLIDFGYKDEKSEEEIEYIFSFDKSTIRKNSGKIEEFPSFADISKLKEVFYEKHIKNLIKETSYIRSYKCTDLKNKELKKVEIESLINPQESFEENKERLKFGADKFIRNFEKIILSKYCFSFDNTNIKKLEPFVDDPNDVNINYFSKNNQICLAYQKKNIKSLELSSNEVIQKPLEEIKIDNDNDIYGSITKINQRWLNKQKFTEKLSEPITDNNKIYYDFKNSLEIPLIEQVFQEFVNQKIRTFQIDINVIIKPNLDFTIGDFITEIYFSFKEENIKIQKLNLEKEIFIEGSIEEINNLYNEKNFLNMNIQSPKLKENNLNKYSSNDIDINSNYEIFKKWKTDRINRKNKYICSGNASIGLMKNTLINNIYDNPKTSVLHNLSIQLNEINDKSNNDNNLKLTTLKSANNKYSKCVKKLKDEIDLSLSNKNSFKSKLDINKFKSENLRMKNKLSINSKNSENEQKNSEYHDIMKKIKKSESEINKKKRKIYVDKIKLQQDKEFEQEIKKEKKYNMIYPIFIIMISLIFSCYKYFWND